MYNDARGAIKEILLASEKSGEGANAAGFCATGAFTTRQGFPQRPP